MFRNVLSACTWMCTLASVFVLACHAYAQSAASPPHTPAGATFALTPTLSPASGGAQSSTAAAVIDGYAIPKSEVVAICLRQDGAFVVDQLVQNYVVDRECRRRGITIDPAEIDARVAALRADVAPSTLDQALLAHHTTLAELRDQFKQDIERERLVVGQVPATKMTHCRVIVVKYDPAGVPASIAGTTRTDAEALAEIKSLQAQLAGGSDFGALAAKYSDVAADKSGDIGVLYKGMHGTDTALLNAGLTLGADASGAVTPQPVTMNDAYALVQAMSTSDSHAHSDDDAYAQALAAYRHDQAQFLEPQEIVALIARSKVVYYVHN